MSVSQNIIRTENYPTYNLSRYFYNPGFYVSLEQQASFLASSRYEQNTGVFSNQRNFSFTGVKYFKRQAIGFTVDRKEESSVFSKNRFYINYCNLLEINKKLTLTGGISLGIFNNYVGQNATGLSYSSWVPDAELGFVFVLDKKYGLGVSSQQIFGSNFLGIDENYELIRNYHLEFWFTNKANLNDTYRFGTRTTLDQISILQWLSGYYLFDNSYGLGVTYNTKNNITPEVILSDFKISKFTIDLRVGYNFSVKGGGSNSISKNSFVFNLNIKGLPREPK